MKSITFLLMTICSCCLSLHVSGQIFNPSDGSTHYGNGTSYHSNGGRNGVVTTDKSVVDCAQFPELCRGLLEEADRKENPEPTPKTPGDANPDTPDKTPGDDGDKKDKKKKKKQPKTQSYSSLPQEDQVAIEEYFEIYQAKPGVWFRQKGGKWFRVNDPSAHTAKIIGLITKK